MPQPQVFVARSGRVPFYIPVEILEGHPTLMSDVKNADFPCSNCVDPDGNPDWHTVKECWDAGTYDPLSGPHIEGRKAIGSRGMIATRFALNCPTCGCAPQNYTTAWMQNGTVDILMIPAGIKRPNRVKTSDQADSIFEQPGDARDDDEKMVKAVRVTKVTDLSPLSRPRKVRKARRAAGDKTPVAATGQQP